MPGETMRALLCEEFGPPETLRLCEVPVPATGPGEVLIRIVATGLNFPDTLVIEDKYQIKPALPFAPGGEMAGIVAAVGEGVADFAIGDQVAALTHVGGMADYVVAPAARVIAVPETMSLDVAGAFTLTYGTVHHAFQQRAALKPGETVLILGASGGVGIAAIEVAKAMGARVIAGASTAAKLAVAREHGADELVNYAEQDLKAAVKELTGGQGVDVIVDPVGDALAEPAFRTMAWGGRFLVIGFAGGKIPAIPLNLTLVKGASIVGVFWGAFVDRDPAQHRANMAELYAMHAAGKLKPRIGACFPLERGADALQVLSGRKAVGKVIVKPGAPGATFEPGGDVSAT